jgi:hypothetical protein
MGVIIKRVYLYIFLFDGLGWIIPHLCWIGSEMCTVYNSWKCLELGIGLLFTWHKLGQQTFNQNACLLVRHAEPGLRIDHPQQTPSSYLQMCRLERMTQPSHTISSNMGAQLWMDIFVFVTYFKHLSITLLWSQIVWYQQISIMFFQVVVLRVTS